MRAYATGVAADGKGLSLKPEELERFARLQDELKAGKELSELAPENRKLLDTLTGRAIVAHNVELMNTGIVSDQEIVTWNPEDGKITFKSGEQATYDVSRPRAGSAVTQQQPVARETMTVDEEVAASRPATLVREEIASPVKAETAPVYEGPLEERTIEQKVVPAQMPAWQKGLTPEQVRASEQAFPQFEKAYGSFEPAKGTVGGMTVRDFQAIDPKLPLEQKVSVRVAGTDDVMRDVEVPDRFRRMRLMMDQNPRMRPTAEEGSMKTGDFIRQRYAKDGAELVKFSVTEPVRPDAVPLPPKP
jgi:hypothetical protein